MSKLQEFLDRNSDFKGYKIAYLTDECIVDTYPLAFNSLDNKDEKVLEVRLFNKEKEIKLFRNSIGEEFKERERDDNDNGEHFSQVQYLDIDKKRTKDKHTIYTMNGGTYTLPKEMDLDKAAIIINYYFGRYEETGRAYIKDWRCVDFVEVD